MGEMGEAFDAAIYGNQQQKKDFGNALYELKEKRRMGACKLLYVEERATFFKEFVVVRQASQFACLPLRYEEVILPRYKLSGATVSRGTSFFTIKMAVVLFLLSIFMMVMGVHGLRRGGSGPCPSAS